MRFKNPGGDLTWMTPLIVLGGPYLAYVFYQEGSTVMAIMAGSMAFLFLLVWLDVKWVAIPLIAWFSFVLLCGVLVMFLKEFSWRMPLRLCAMGFTIYSLWDWYRRVDPADVDVEMQELERLISSPQRPVVDQCDLDGRGPEASTSAA